MGQKAQPAALPTQLPQADTGRTLYFTMKRVSSFRASLVRAASWIAAASSCLAFAAPVQEPAQTDGLSSSAEYIAGFVRYVHWQDEERLQAWNVCIVGSLPAEQDRAYADRLVRGKPFKVHRLDAEDPLGECQVLDLTAVDAGTARKLLARARHLPILAVGSGGAFCSAGGQICLHLADSPANDRQKFEVNISAMREAALGVSARLLTLGTSRTASKDTP
jgi:hypothetical protein